MIRLGTGVAKVEWVRRDVRKRRALVMVVVVVCTFMVYFGSALGLERVMCMG